MKLPQTAYPLNWPIGWRRTPEDGRTRAKFVKKGRGNLRDAAGVYQGWDGNKPLTIEQARVRLVDELRRIYIGPGEFVLSANLRLRQDGGPISGQREPLDPGVAVYWQTDFGRSSRCMAIDLYDRVADNIAAIAATLEAMRAIERHGGAAIMDRAFTGFAALPAPEQPFEVLGVGANATVDEIERAYRRLASEHHPDKGGDQHQMARINDARARLLEQHPQ